MNKKMIGPLAVTALLAVIAVLAIIRGDGSDVEAADDRFRIDGTTLTAYLGSDTFIAVPDTITVIGEEAFKGNTTLAGVEIPDSVTSIAYNAFKDCTALTDITIPDSVTRVGPGAFEGCTKLATVEIGENVSSWGTGVFANCSGLASVMVDKDNEYITEYNGAIYNGNMTMLYQVLPARAGENYVMPDSVRDIDTYAFWNLANTKNVKLSDKVAVVPTYSMTNMGSVQNVILTDSVTTIEEKAFSDNANLLQVGMPKSVKNINKAAFKNCNEDMAIFTQKGTAADTFGHDNNIPVIYEPILPKDFMDSNENLDVMPNVGDHSSEAQQTQESSESSSYTVEGVNGATAADTTDTDDDDTDTEQETQSERYANPLDIPESDDVLVKTIVASGNAVMLMNNHDGTVYGVPNGVTADVKTEAEERQEQSEQADEAQEQQQAQTQEEQTQPQSEQSSSEEESSKPSSTGISVTVESSSSPSIPQRKYYKQKSLTEFKFDDDVKTIGRLAFAESGLKAVDIPDSVTAIEYGAFMNCNQLKDVTIPDTVTNIATRAFSGTPWLDEWLKADSEGADDDFLIVGDGILLAYRGNEQYVTIPEGVKQIGSEVFKGHTELINVDVPETVTRIGSEAFRNCSSLVGLSGCEGLRTVIRGAFYGTQISETEFS